MINKIETKTTTQIILNNEDIIALLREAKYIPEEAIDISVIFNVPGGGDYSNMSLNIDKHDPIEVFFTTTTRDEETEIEIAEEIPAILKPQSA